jgi:mannose-6-phosphate isomerase-like protein (cupin superfamily)
MQKNAPLWRIIPLAGRSVNELVKKCTNKRVFLPNKDASMEIVNRTETTPFTTKDGSTIREILAYRNSSIRSQSLAEAIVPPGITTHAHYHRKAEEIYYILTGSGEVVVGEAAESVKPGDGIAIPPGAPHQIRNTGEEDLVFLCCCLPAYEHEDTILIPSLFPRQSGRKDEGPAVQE